MTKITHSGTGRGFGGIGRALSSRDFRLYSLGNLVSLLGTWIHRMALGWLTWELTASPAWLGTIAFAAMVPPIILGPISGTFADRIGSRRTAMVAMLLESANIVTLAALVATGAITVHLLLALALAQGIFFSFDFPVRHALVPDLVPRSDLSAAIAVNTATFHVTSFVGPVIGGFIIAQFGTAPAFLFNALSFGLFFFILRAMRLTRESHAGNERRGFVADLLDGFRYTFGHPAIRLMFLLAIICHVMMRPYYDLLPAFADQVFDRKIDGLTILAAASGLGGLIGGVGLALRGRMEGLTKSFLWALVISALFLTAFALTDTFWLAVALLVPVGVGLVVVGLSASFATGGPALGALMLGWLGEVFGMGAPLALFSFVCAVAALASARALTRMTVQMEDDASAPRAVEN